MCVGKNIILLMGNGERQDLGNLTHSQGICKHPGSIILGEWTMPHLIPFVNKSVFETVISET